MLQAEKDFQHCRKMVDDAVRQAAGEPLPKDSPGLQVKLLKLNCRTWTAFTMPR